MENFLPFSSNWNCCLQTLSVWKSLNCVVWERVKICQFESINRWQIDSDPNHRISLWKIGKHFRLLQTANICRRQINVKHDSNGGIYFWKNSKEWYTVKLLLSNQMRDLQKAVAEEKGSPNATKVHHMKPSDNIYYTLTTHYFQQNPMLLVLIWIISLRQFKWVPTPYDYLENRAFISSGHCIRLHFYYTGR